MRKTLIAAALLCAAIFFLVNQDRGALPHTPQGTLPLDPVVEDFSGYLAEATVVPVVVPDDLLGELEDLEELEELDEEICEVWVVVEEQLAQMSIYEKIGQLFVFHFYGHEINTTIRYQIENFYAGGFILFARNVDSIGQVQRLTSSLQEVSSTPLFIAIDEEGGRVSRVGRLFSPQIGTAFSIGQTGDPQAAFDANYTIGERLLYLGINMNFAPVADIWSNPDNTVIGHRAFGTEPEIVAEMTVAAVNGLQEAGVMAVIKHFPGHGDTHEDSHFHLAYYHHDRERFDSVEAIPFISGIETGTVGVMVGHIATPQLHPDNPSLPATFSSYLLQDILRGEMGFDGLIITDALDMRGLTNYFNHAEIAVNSFLAGADILLMPADPHRAVMAMREAYHDGRITEERLNESVRRILWAKYGLN